MDKRKVPRYRKRIQLQFWSVAEKTPRKGFTQNVSVMGMFIATNSPFKPGTRIFLEIPSGHEKLLFQAEVRYAARVDPALQRVKPSGMGVRLLRVDEVMSELLKLKETGVEVIEIPQAVAQRISGASAAIPEAEESAEVAEPEAPVFPVTYETPHDLANSYERDIKFGGLFVAAPEPAEQDETVMIEFRFGWDSDHVVRVEAQVVKKFASAEGSIAGEAVAGMGVAFSNPADVMAQFKDVFSDLE